VLLSQVARQPATQRVPNDDHVGRFHVVSFAYPRQRSISILLQPRLIWQTLTFAEATIVETKNVRL